MGGWGRHGAGQLDTYSFVGPTYLHHLDRHAVTQYAIILSNSYRTYITWPSVPAHGTRVSIAMDYYSGS